MHGGIVGVMRAWRILEDFLDSMAADRCEPRPDILDALFARPGFRLPAWAGRREGGIAVSLAELPAGLWTHPYGEPYGDDEHPAVDLREGARLTFALSEQPDSWSVDADRPGALSVRWDGLELALEAVSDVRVRALTLTSAGSVRA